MSRKITVAFVVLAGAVAYQLCFRGSRAGALEYRGSWRQAVEEARRAEKPILLNFGGPW